MANPKTVLHGIILALPPKDKENAKESSEESKKEESKEKSINELVEKVFTTRNLVHFAHWNTHSFAKHMALNELYEEIVDVVDDIVETYQGEFGLLEELETECGKLDKDIVEIVQADADWIKKERKKIANGSSTIENLLDELTGTYNRVLYKLKNLG